MCKAWLCLLLFACSLGAMGCLRWGYAERDRARGGSDSGADGGRGGSSGNAGRGGSQAGSGAGGMGGRAGSDESDDGGLGPADGGMTERDGAGSDDDDEDEDDEDDASAADSGVSAFCPEREGAIFCDGFEDPDFGRWSYPVIRNGSLTRSTERKRSGDASLRAITGAAALDNEARYATSELGNLKAGDLWMRYYYYLPGAVVVNTHFSAGVMSEIKEPYAGFSLIVRASRVDLNTMAGPVQGTMMFPRDRWVCVELHVKIDPSAGLFEAYLDEVLAVRSGVVNSVPADGFRNAEVGIHYAEAAQGPVEAFVDDVVIGRTRMGCD